jgi:hypothetical protein
LRTLKHSDSPGSQLLSDIQTLFLVNVKVDADKLALEELSIIYQVIKKTRLLTLLQLYYLENALNAQILTFSYSIHWDSIILFDIQNFMYRIEWDKHTGCLKTATIENKLHVASTLMLSRS